MSPLPFRPRLADHALVRRHVVDGEEIVVVHDARSGDLLRMEPRLWELVAGADGTRDFDALVLAAARRGAFRRATELRAALDHLHAAGLLADGVGYPAPPGPVAEERPLDVLPGFGLTCDESGDCCTMYGSVLFSPLEAARARALLPGVLGGGDRAERAFMPERGATADGDLAVTLVDGRCGYLAGDGRCGLHVAGGAPGKPRACRVYPASFADDGEHVRVSIGVECPCVLASVGKPGGAPLVDPGARVRTDLGPGVRVAIVPDPVVVASGIAAPRAAYVAWSRRALAALPDDGDAVAWAWSLGAALEAGGIDADVAAAAAACLPEAAALEPRLTDLRDRAAARLESAERWRGARDRTRMASGWMAAAAARLCDAEALSTALADARFAADERFLLRAEIHGHQLLGEAPVAAALQDRAVRMLLGRAVADLLPEGDPAARHPLALVTAMIAGMAGRPSPAGGGA